MVFLVIGIFVFIFLRRFIFLALLFFFSFEMQHFMYAKELKINPGHVFFFSVLLARESIGIAIAYVLAAGLLGEASAGYIEAKTFVAYPIYCAIVMVSYLMRGFDVLISGLILTLLCHAALYASADAVAEPLPEKIFEVIVPGTMNLVYFGTLSNFMMDMIKMFI